jgi:serpin B
MASMNRWLAACILSVWLASPLWGAAEKGGSMPANDFAFKFYSYEALASGKEENLLVSPFSVESALGLALAGAGGQTARELATVLGGSDDAASFHETLARQREQAFNQGNSSGQSLSIANALFAQKGLPIESSYLELTGRFYGAGVRETDYRRDPEEARRSINQWVEEQTRDKIKDLIPRGGVDQQTRMVLANAIYFYGLWATPFKQSATREEDFHLQSGQPVRVPMMRALESYRYAAEPDLQVLELPYRSEALAMVVILPAQGTDFDKAEKSLTSQRVRKLLDRLASAEVSVTLPKYRFDGTRKLRPSLSAMGAISMFGGQADFSGMTKEKGWFCSEVIHKAFIAVDEKGTEAAAATATMMAMARYVKKDPVIFRADRPFIFAVVDRSSGAVLFIGRLMNPAKAT